MTRSLVFIGLVALLGGSAAAQVKWKPNTMDRPQPPVISPGPPPSDAVVLFNGTDLSGWASDADSGPAKWAVRDGYVEVAPGTGGIHTRRLFGDVQLHVEWAAPLPAEGVSQERGNSGVFLMSHYEVQVLDIYHNLTYADGAAGAVYGQTPPLVNPAKPPGEWQTYDIIFHRPLQRRAGAGQYRDHRVDGARRGGRLPAARRRAAAGAAGSRAEGAVSQYLDPGAEDAGVATRRPARPKVAARHRPVNGCSAASRPTPSRGSQPRRLGRAPARNSPDPSPARRFRRSASSHSSS